ncbi:MAG: hypothetical protein WCD69_21050 [Xanthobacteraceae bacterium]
MSNNVPQHNPLRKTLAYGAAVIGFATLGAVVLYFATVGLLYLRSNICHSDRSSTWCSEANIAKLPDLPKAKDQNAHK